jgi:hypothetical protein
MIASETGMRPVENDVKTPCPSASTAKSLNLGLTTLKAGQSGYNKE